MVKGNHKFLLLSIGLCLVTFGVWGQSSVEVDSENNKLHILWQDQFWSYLESSKHAQFRTASAIRLINSNDPITIELGEQLIADVLDTPFPDSASLWLLASDCRRRESADWCEPGGVYEMLIQADPENAAVLMLRFSQASFRDDELSLDTEVNRQLLFKAAEASHFDVYWGRGADKLYEEALKYAKLNPVPPVPELEDSTIQAAMEPHVYAFFGAVGLIVTAPTIGYGNITALCSAQAGKQYSDGVAACKKLAHIMKSRGYDMMTMTVGYGIEKAMFMDIVPDDPRIHQLEVRRDIFRVASICRAPVWQTNSLLWPELRESSLMNWAKNLSKLGETESARLSAFQEYSISPDEFVVNPAECDKLEGMDDDAMEEFLNGQAPINAWQTMQEAGLEISGRN